MKITVEKIENYTEFIIEGRLDANTSQELEDVLTKEINDGEKNVLINFKGIDYISSSGLRVFLIAAKMLESKSKKLNFCSMQDYIKEVFDIAGFSILFNFYDSKEAVKI